MISYKSIIRLAATFETGIQGKKKHWPVFLLFCLFQPISTLAASPACPIWKEEGNMLPPIHFRPILRWSYLLSGEQPITSDGDPSRIETDKIYLQRMKNWHLRNLEVLICPIVRRLSCPARQSKMHLPPLSQLSWNSNTISFRNFPSKIKIWFISRWIVVWQLKYIYLWWS